MNIRTMTACAAIAAALLLAACSYFEPKYPSPLTGRPATAAELVAERQGEEARVKREQAAEESALRQDQAKSRAEFETKVIDANAAYKARLRAASKTNRDAQAEADAARQEFDDQMERIGAAGKAEVERLNLAFGSMDRRHTDESAGVKAAYDTAFDALSASYQQRLGVAQGVASSPILQSVPVLGPALQQASSSGLFQLLLGGGGAAMLAGRGRKQSDDSYEEGRATAKKEAEEARAREHAAWDQSMAMAFALMRPPPVQIPASITDLSVPPAKPAPAADAPNPAG